MGINRNIVECKGVEQCREHDGQSVVLIETLWNVKTEDSSPCPEKPSCINRNIVECKANFTFKDSLHAIVLIETLWNVKIVCCTFPGTLRRGINRNIVECKVVYARASTDHQECINRNIVECKGS